MKEKRKVIFLGTLFTILIFLISTSFVGADISGVVFTNPVAGANVSGVINVTWTNTNTWGGLQLTYKKDGCQSVNNWTVLLDGINGSQTTYSWNTAGLNGIYCLRLDNVNYTSFSGNFTIDNIKPTVEANGPYSQILYKGITFNSSGSNDGNGTGIMSYLWYFGDGTNSTLANPNHTYNSMGSFIATLIVKDYVGNNGSDTAIVTINPLPTISLTNQEVLANNLLTYNFSSNVINLLNCSIVTITSEPPLSGASITNISNNCSFSWTPTNTQRGIYSVIVKAENVSSEKYYSFNVSVYSWMISLTEGWNLISIPLVPEDNNKNLDNSISNVLKSIQQNVVNTTDFRSVQQYDPVNDAWRYNKPSGVSWYYTSASDKLINIVPGYSYWIKMAKNSTLKGFGSKGVGAIYGPSIPPSVNLAGGWNLIGKYGLVPVAKSNETNNLVFDLQVLLGNLADYPIMDIDGNSIGVSSLLYPTKGYWVFLSGNNGKPIKYTRSEADYNFL